MAHMIRIRVLQLIIGIFVCFLLPTSAVGVVQTDVTKVILSNGLTLLVRPEPKANIVAVEIFIRIGATDENESNAGIGHLLAGSILAGTKSRSPEKIARLISEIGGSFHSIWHWNCLEVYAVTSPRSWEETIELLADAVINCRLDSSSIEYSRKMLLKEAQAQEDDSFTHAYTVLRRLIQSGTPYDRPYLGSVANIKTISEQEVRQFYEKNISADRMVISVVGNVDLGRVIRKVEVCFGNMRRLPRKQEPTLEFVSPSRKLSVEKSGTTTYVLLGYPAPGIESVDYVAMAVANVLLGGSKSSLLFTKLREEHGLGYQVGSLYPPLKLNSHIVAYISLDSDRATTEAIELIQNIMLKQVEVLRTGDFTEEALERAKRFLIGRHALAHERTRDRAFYLGWYEAIGLGYQFDFTYPDKIRQITKEDIKRVSSRYLSEPNWVVLSGVRRG
jgi:predicted Zn-dependent peptidase